THEWLNLPLVKVPRSERDRESGFLTASPVVPIQKGKLAHEVVKRGSEIVSNVTDHEGNHWVKWGDFIGRHSQTLPLRVKEHSGLVAFSFRAIEERDSRVDFLEMLLCPPNLEASRI